MPKLLGVDTMNEYLRAVGFSNIDKKNIESLIHNICEKPDKRYILGINYDNVKVEYYKSYGHGIGLVGKGNLDEKENISIEVCEPYVYSDMDIEVKSYLVECIDDVPIIIFEDENSENEIAFELQNTIDYIKNKEEFISSGLNSKKLKKINIAGLSLYGTVVLPVLKDTFEKELQIEENKYYKNLIVKSKNGDEEAIELLTLYEQQNSEIIRERLKEEDFLSVVESYFLPSDESDLSYSVLGSIENVNLIVNSVTKEEVYKLDIDIIDIKVQVFINKDDLIGLPMKGMRFMGMCKLQGKVIF